MKGILIKRIGVLTSGGDAPGMNAAIRAVVRTAIYNQVEVVGILCGYSGLVEKRLIPMQSHSVSKIISQGGTMLKSSRCPEFRDPAVRKLAYDNLREANIDALVVLGGDGSFCGAHALQEETGFPVVGIPCTIDNDIYGSDFTIGFDTASNTAVQAIDKIRDTADSHNLLFFVEVMGRDAGFIGLNTSIAVGAESVLLPEVKSDVQSLCNYIVYERRKNKSSGIIIVSEGNSVGSAHEVAQKVNEILPDYETRVTTLGHIQRGGTPSCNDRVLASILGNAAVNALLRGTSNVMVGQVNGKAVCTPLQEAFTKHSEINQSLYNILQILST